MHTTTTSEPIISRDELEQALVPWFGGRYERCGTSLIRIRSIRSSFESRTSSTRSTGGGQK